MDEGDSGVDKSLNLAYAHDISGFVTIISSTIRIVVQTGSFAGGQLPSHGRFIEVRYKLALG